MKCFVYPTNNFPECSVNDIYFLLQECCLVSCGLPENSYFNVNITFVSGCMFWLHVSQERIFCLHWQKIFVKLTKCQFINMFYALKQIFGMLNIVE